MVIRLFLCTICNINFVKGVLILAKIYPLFSSSKGNAIYIGDEKNGILIDAGVTCKRLVEGLNRCGLSPESVRGIFITHEHTDHISGLKVFTKNYAAKVFAQNLNAEYLAQKDIISPRSVLEEIDEKEMEFSGFEVKAFETSHDTRQSCGYKIKCPDGKTVCVCTDLGYVSDTVHENLVGSDLVLLEANYDKEMLRNGPYPFSLKQRIVSKTGHLSNVDSGTEIEKLVKNGTKQIILGHLSQENNTPNIAGNTVIATASEVVYKQDYLLRVAPVETRGEVCEF